MIPLRDVAVVSSAWLKDRSGRTKGGYVLVPGVGPRWVAARVITPPLKKDEVPTLGEPIGITAYCEDHISVAIRLKDAVHTPPAPGDSVHLYEMGGEIYRWDECAEEPPLRVVDARFGVTYDEQDLDPASRQLSLGI